MPLLFAILLTAGIAFWVLTPLLSRETPEAGGGAAAGIPPDLLLAKERAYESIRDLDFDFHTGKLSEQDYRNLRLQLQQEALEALKRLEGEKGRRRKVRRREGSEER